MAVVYKAKDRLLNRYVLPQRSSGRNLPKMEQFIENFRKESQAAAGLSHPNIVNAYDVGREGNIILHSNGADRRKASQPGHRGKRES